MTSDSSAVLEMLETAGIETVPGTRFGEPCISFRHPAGSLTVSLLGAQILEWSPRECNNLLWTTQESLHVPGNPVRGGIPVCWPWFGAPHAPFNGPGHGFARRRRWMLVAASYDSRNVSLHFRLGLSDDRYCLDADYTITVGDRLALQLVTTNRGTAPCPVTPAFHPYFAIDELAETRIRFSEPATPFDRLAGTHRGPTHVIPFNGDETELQWPWQDLELDGGAGNTALKITSTDATHGVAWNPGPAKTRAIDDLGNDAFRHFVCIEPGRLDDARETIPAGEKAAISMTVQPFLEQADNKTAAGCTFQFP